MNNVVFMKHMEGNIIENGVPIQHHVVDRIGNDNIVFVREKHNNDPTLRYIEIEKPIKNVRFQELPYAKLSNKIDRMPTPYLKSKKVKKSKKTAKGKKTKNNNKLTRKTSKQNKSKK